MKLPEVGSKWIARNNHIHFYVLHTIELEGNTWIHYKEHTSDREYSCYVESFLQRFMELPK
jgi:hypothetical protein